MTVTLGVLSICDGKLRKFRQSRSRLYYSDMGEQGTRENHSFINTVHYNKFRYNSRDSLRAVDSRKLQSIIASASHQHFTRILYNKKIMNCPIVKADAGAAEDVFGAPLQVLQGKTTRSKTMHVRAYYESISTEM